MVAVGWFGRWAKKQSQLLAHRQFAGTYTLLVRRWDGISWAVLFNQRSDTTTCRTTKLTRRFIARRTR